MSESRVFSTIELDNLERRFRISPKGLTVNIGTGDVEKLIRGARLAAHDCLVPDSQIGATPTPRTQSIPQDYLELLMEAHAIIWGLCTAYVKGDDMNHDAPDRCGRVWDKMGRREWRTAR